MTTAQYIDSISKRYSLGNSTEHTFRGDLQQLIESLIPGVRATNEPKRQLCGAPDYILTRGDIPIGFIEAKDIGDSDLHGSRKTGNKEQFDRYKASLGNLIFTDYLTFHLYRDGQYLATHSIGALTENGILPINDAFLPFEALLRDFASHVGQNIKSSKRLAELMAGKARLLSDVIEKSLTSDVTKLEDSTLKEQMKAFKEILIHDITPKEFADVYAQTIAYGMFAARLHDATLPTFSRHEAAELIPKSNPFLRKLFGYIAGPDIDDRIKWIVDGLVDIFLHCNVEELLRNYGKSTKMEDPIIHFYETFLSEYDPKLRKSRGVWYTPQPVVDFIVRAVDDILKSEFGLPQGLADNSKIKIKIDEQGKKIEKEVHKVQILDPATGTGTFLAEVIKLVHKRFKGLEGIWSNYVDSHLIPRLNGFEILMASYAMAHLKLDLLLTETGYKPTTNQRFRVFLTNSLEDSHPDTGTLFANWLSTEANEANHIKRDTPVMCVIGNPPYSISSTNRGDWIQNLLIDYKKNLSERKINIDDDYIKFIRYGQYYIDNNGEGILAYISSNSFLDGVTHRQMRKYLLQSFDSIYIVDLHGNSKKKEVSPDGNPDQNVFDIMTGVSINIFIKHNSEKKNAFADVYHYDFYGTRDSKYLSLNNGTIHSINWSKLSYKEPYYFFTPKDLSRDIGYNSGIKLEDLFLNKNTGIQTKNDALTIKFTPTEITDLEKDFLNLDIDSLKKKYGITEGTWKITDAKLDLLSGNYDQIRILVKAFDIRYTLLNRKSSGFLGRPRFETMQHMIKTENLALLVSRQNKSNTIDSFFITRYCSEMKSAERTIQSYHFPLYVVHNTDGQKSFEQISARTPNLSLVIVRQLENILGLPFISEKQASLDTFSPIDILDYIYAILHSPIYRSTYKELLKIDFPRVPYPKDSKTFWKLVHLGEQVRLLHLMESPTIENYITQYPIDGDNIINKPVFQSGRVYINDTQYFDNVPQIAWEFYIGGYQPAQKWLKDRKGRKLEYEDILHYQKIIVALVETDRLMKEIDKIDFL